MDIKIKQAIDQLIITRGYNLDEFYSWDLKKLPDFSQLRDIQKASERIVQAVYNKEVIAVYGDYDVDGTTSCALLYHFFKSIGVAIKTLQPSRFIDGYGLHVSSIEWAKEQEVDLLITVDCGVTSIEAAKHAQKLGVDLIITDHHQAPPGELPPALAVINPNRLDEPSDSPMRKLAGVGVAFALSIIIRKKLIEDDLIPPPPSLYPLLTFVALGTICDLAWLNPMNLKMVRHGLKIFPKTEYPGLQAFLTDQDRKEPILPSEKLSFFIGPIINSKGRLEHPELALELLTCDDEQRCQEIFHNLLAINQERKIIQAQVYTEARKQVIQNLTTGQPLINIVYSASWHEGVIGIVASKLVETFKVPAIVLTHSEEPGVMKASCRTAGELDIYEALSQCKDLFLKFGGHKAAAGFSLKTDKLSELHTRLHSYLSNIPAIIRTKTTHYDLAVSINDLSLELLEQLERLEPFGVGNPKPLLRIIDGVIENFTILKGNHIKWSLSNNKSRPYERKIGGISFNYFDKWDCPSPENIMKEQSQQITPQIHCYLSMNHYNGRSYLQALVSDITV